MTDAAFTPATFADTLPFDQRSYAPSHLGTDPLAHLAPSSAAKLTSIQQRGRDLNSAIPPFSQLQEAQLTVAGHEQRIKHLSSSPASEGGFSLGADALQVVVEQRLLARAKTELERLTSLREIRSARWTTCGQLERAIADWLASGVPGNCQLIEAVEDAPLSELLVKADGGRIEAAVQRYRLRLRELAADLHRVKSSPFTSQEAKAVARKQINLLADAAEPDVSRVVELLEPVQFATTRTRTLAQSLDPKLPPSLVHTETQDSLGLICWLFRRELTEKVESLIDQASTGSEAISEKQRQEQEAQISSDMLAIERAEVACIWAAEAAGEIIDFRSDTTAQVVLGLALETRPIATALPPTSPEHATTIVIPGGR